MKKTLLLGLALGLFTQVYAQLPTDSYSVSSPCPGGNNIPSELAKINTDGSITPIGTVNENGTGIVVNGLGYNQADQATLYAMRVQPLDVNSVLNNTPPPLYRINLTTASATNVGLMIPPPTPTSGLTPPSPGKTARDLRQTLNFVGDSDTDGTYYLGGVTFRVSSFTLGGIPLPGSITVTDVRLYVGTTTLIPGPIAAPDWKGIVVSDPTTTAVVEAFRTQTELYLNAPVSTPVPEGGIQDWVFDKSSGNLVSYLGQSGQYLTITNPATDPVAVTTTPTVPLPPLPPNTVDNDSNIGSMFSDKFNNVYVVRAGSGEIFRVDKTTGSWTGQAFGAALGCNRGDAVSFQQALPLPVTLTRFEATAAGQTVRLSWATATEAQAAYFEVERSATATRWDAVARVTAGNQPAGQEYTALDTRPLPGLAYYRLAMHDRDGTVAYSDVRTVGGPTALAAMVYPNPVRGAAQVLLPAPAEAATLELLSARGQVVRRLAAPAGVGRVSLSTAGLPSGVYMLRVRQSGGSSTTRLVVLDN